MQSLDWLLLFRAPYGERVLDAVLTTLELSLISWGFALAIGVVAGLLREAPLRAVRLAATAFVEVFRNVPLLVQLFFIYFVLPRALPLPLRQILFQFGWEFVSAVLTLSLYTGAKIAEHVRSGLNAVGVGIRQAAMSTGLTWTAAQRYVVAPLVLLAVASLFMRNQVKALRRLAALLDEFRTNRATMDELLERFAAALGVREANPAIASSVTRARSPSVP